MSYSVFPQPVTPSKGPLDITWTNLGYQTGNGLSTLTFSSIGGYKTLKLVLAGVSFSANANQTVIFNGDTGSNYMWEGRQALNGSTAADAFRSGNGALTQSIQLGSSASGTMESILIINNASDTTPHKHFNLETADYNSTFGRAWRGINGVWRGTSAITSLTINNASGTWTQVSPFGFYLYGAN